MLKQICMVTLALSLASGISWGLVSALRHSDVIPWSLAKDFWMASFRVGTTLGDPTKLTQEVRLGSRHVQKMSTLSFLKNPWVKQQMRLVDTEIARILHQMLGVFGASFLLILCFFILRGQRTLQKKRERGAVILPPKTLKSLIRRKRQASDLTLDGLPLLKNKETSHILLTGTTGAGKTNAFHTLLPQIRKRGNRALVVDLTGDFVNRYYREGHDILLNPFDGRTALWSPWGECLEEPHYDALAAAVITKSDTSEPFWEEAAKALLSTALKELARQGVRSVGRLYDILIKEDLGVFAKFFRGTEASSYAHPDGEKMTLSIRATLANALQGFRYLAEPVEGQGFAIRRWIQEEEIPDQWLFLNARPDQRETLRPLLSCWIDTSISSLMTLPPSPNRRLWFILDELPSLALGLAEARKYGGCVMAGVQSISQISSTYGTNLAQTLLDLLNTKIFFRNTDPTTTAWISKVLGECELTEPIENLSYGANTMRDGVNLAQQTRTKPLVLPSEIGALKDCEAYIKLPGALPVTKIQMRYKNF
jgi:type IV conjugative transfer system coupling protein TraD